MQEDFAKKPGIEVFLEELDKAANAIYDRSTVLHVELPTGYGKSIASALIASKLAHREGALAHYAQRVVHTVPTRYLVEDLVRRSYNRELVIRGQCMLFEPSLKDPYFLSDLVFTTFDSYSLNFFKIPVSEVELMLAGFTHGHFDIPRYAILSAVNVFDEYHIWVPGDTEVKRTGIFESKAWTTLNVIVKHLVFSKVPVVLETATPRLNALQRLLNNSDANVVRIALKLNKDSEARGITAVYDEDFTVKLEKARYETIIEKGKFTEVIQRYIHELEKPLLIVCNNVRTAVEVYEILKKSGEFDVHLLHALFTLGDRTRKLLKIRKLMKSKEKSDLVVVTTQVIEVGVNLDFAAMITDAAPLASLVQRVGRVNRHLEDQISRLVIVYDPSRAYEDKGSYADIYDLNLTKHTLEVLHKEKERGEIGWRMSAIENKINLAGRQFITISGLSGRVYSNESDSPPEIDRKYRRLLTALLNPQISSEQAQQLLLQLGSFVHDDVLVPLYVPSGNPEKGALPAFKRSHLVACPSYKLGLEPRSMRGSPHFDEKLASKVLKLENGHLWVVIEKPRKDRIFEVVDLKLSEVIEGILSGIVRIDGHIAFLRALVSKPESYSKEEGLRVW
jgi:CRISPR-associated helicase Cas3